MICKVINSGEYHGHMDKILSSKIVNSESTAPKYYLYKYHKKVESWRPVVSGCSSNTLGLSNMLSDIVESICSSMSTPLEVISSEDLLSRIENFNKWTSKQETDWRQAFQRKEQQLQFIEKHVSHPLYGQILMKSGLPCIYI